MWTISDGKITFMIADADERLNGLKLILAEYDSEMRLVKVKIGDNSDVADGIISSVCELPESENYKYMIWDKNSEPIEEAITQIY